MIARVCTLVACMVLAAAPAAAGMREPFPHTVEFWGGVAGWSGNDAAGFATGGATGGTFLFQVGLPVQAGFELGFARFATDQAIGMADEFEASAVARYRLPRVAGTYPFVGGRAGYTRLSANYARFRLEQNGAFAGGSAGLEIPLGARVMLAGTGDAMYYKYQDTTIFLEGISLPQSGGTAWRYWGRLGLSFRWGP